MKSVFTTNRWGYSVTVARNRLHRPGELYTAQEIDFLAAYVVVHDVWYILPVEEVADVDHIRLYPGGTKRRDGGRYEKYREAWDQLPFGRTGFGPVSPTKRWAFRVFGTWAGCESAEAFARFRRKMRRYRERPVANLRS